MRLVAIAFVWVLVLMTAPSASAQPATTFENLGLKVKPGETAHVSLPDGRQFSGRVVTLTREAIELESAATRRRFSVDEVDQVAVNGDSLRNGALIGLVAGGVFGGLFGYGFNERLGDAAQGAVIFGALGAGIGVGFDALNRGTTVVYRAPRPRASIAPILAPRTVGLAAALRW